MSSNQFSFSNPIYEPYDGATKNQKMELTTQSERIHVKPRWLDGDDDDDNNMESTDTASRQLWKHRPPSVAQPDIVARRRREMMEMLQSVPDFEYELSMTDIVELPVTEEDEHGVKMRREVGMDKRHNMNKDQKKINNSSNKKKAKKRLVRSKSMDSGGFLLRMFLPVSLSGGKKSNGASPSGGSRVAPKYVMNFGGKNGNGEGLGGEKCKKDAACEASKNTRHDADTHRRRKMGGCYYFLQPKAKARGD